MISGQGHEWVQDALAVTVKMLLRMGIEVNLKKTKAMVCTPGFIWGKWEETSYKRREKGEGVNFRQRKRMRVSCIKCGVTVAAS